MKGGAHYGSLEVGRTVMNSLTRVAKDTLAMDIYELDTTRPKGGQGKDSTSSTPQQGGGK